MLLYKSLFTKTCTYCYLLATESIFPKNGYVSSKCISYHCKYFFHPVCNVTAANRILSQGVKLWYQICYTTTNN